MRDYQGMWDKEPNMSQGLNSARMRRSQKMLRVTVREDFSYELATDLINDLKTVIEWLDHHFIYSGMVPASMSANIPLNTSC